ncbi:P-selectin glycoprotein ligand 1 [Xenopus laevis]|uniref:P-selectin glycoprotein ligand 1 n=2 Tax=Xenopus laevis TaxID=8355 RepID=A0A1L8HQ27_XENLA|nr:P-selectin glycoprotein ligand 1 [Xenopus laevis]OCT98161.1 hypothetical protein XELAEV_18010391mg [Xenopus laevis]
MLSPWVAFLELSIFILLSFAYKLPAQDNGHLALQKDETLQDPATGAYEGKMELQYSRLFRKKRENANNSVDAGLENSSAPISWTSEPMIVTIKPTSLLEESTDASMLVTHSESSLDLSETNSISPEQETTQTTLIHKSTGSPDSISFLNSTESPEVNFSTTEDIEETTNSDHIHTETIHSTTQSKNDTGHANEDNTLSPPLQFSKKSQFESIVTSTPHPRDSEDTTKPKTDDSISSSKPMVVTFITTSAEHSPPVHSLMRQCMLAILILAVICTIFIISTIALAAKLSRVKSRYKMRQSNFTEMTCITSLLPESDQQSKVKPKKLKTFATNVEESDGDNTTLNSFLPDH